MAMSTDRNNKSSKSNMSNNLGLTELGTQPTTAHDNVKSLSSWRETIKVSMAKSRKIRGGNFVQISTVDPTTLEPRIRTVVFRGFLPDPSQVDTKGEDATIMKMITDLRSSKVNEVTKHTTPSAELLWWFSKSSEQYRVLGTLKFVGSGTFELDDDVYYAQARKQQWGNLSDSAREQFFWREPNTPYEEQVKVPTGGRDEEGKLLPPPDNFLLMLLFPKRVDYLRLGDNYRQLDELENDQWISNRVNP